MENKNKNNASIIPINSTSLVKVENALAITEKILQELQKRDVELQDTTPLALLYKNEQNNKFYTIIEAETLIPVNKTLSIELPIINQKTIQLNIYQGHINWGEANIIVAKLIIDNITQPNNGLVVVDFIFEVDKNGVLHIVSKENSTGKSLNIKIKNYKGLSESEIEKLKKNANRSNI